MYARIAQLVEHTTDTGGVLGSNPSARTMNTMKKTYNILALLSIIVIIACAFYVNEAQKNLESSRKVPEKLIFPVIPGQNIVPRYVCNSAQAKLAVTDGVLYNNTAIGFSLYLSKGWIVPSKDSDDPHSVNCSTRDSFEIHSWIGASQLYEDEYKEYLQPKGSKTVKIYTDLIPDAIVREFIVINPEEVSWPHWSTILFKNEKKAYFFGSMKSPDQYPFLSSFKLLTPDATEIK